MPLTVTSLQNSRIKDVIKLAKPGEREQRQATVVEGDRESERALTSGIVPLEAYICPALFSDTGRKIAKRLVQLDAERRTLLIEVTPEVYEKIAYRGESSGILLVIPYLDRNLKDFDPPSPAFIAVIEGVEKPGNLGAILRTADAAGLQAVIVNAGVTDTHNPNVIRASLGALFTTPIFESPLEATIQWLHQRNIQIIAATPDASQRYTEFDYTKPTAIVMGSEAYGLSHAWRNASTHLVTIPMFGVVDSLNLATSTALLLYEVVRQRNL